MDLRRLIDDPPLSAREERDLARAVRSGDQVAGRRLVEASLRLVALAVLRRRVVPSSADDAFQDGVLALLEAVARFDPERGVRLATYAWRRVDGAVCASLARSPETAMPWPGDLAEAGGELGVEIVEPALERALRGAVDALGPLERAVLGERYGLAPDGRTRSRREVAERWDLTPDRVRGIERRALRAVRRRLATVASRAPRSGADPL